jgi:hypothetical protein
MANQYPKPPALAIDLNKTYTATIQTSRGTMSPSFLRKIHR